MKGGYRAEWRAAAQGELMAKGAEVVKSRTRTGEDDKKITESGKRVEVTEEQREEARIEMIYSQTREKARELLEMVPRDDVGDVLNKLAKSDDLDSATANFLKRVYRM